jgi:hypothetical protein
MPVIVKLPSGNWRAQVRRKGKYISNTFRRRADADTWALESERTIDKEIEPKAVNPRAVTKLRQNIDVDIQDMLELWKRILRYRSGLVRKKLPLSVLEHDHFKLIRIRH